MRSQTDPRTAGPAGLALVLMVVGAKMLTAKWLKEMLGSGFNFFLLGFVLLILAAGVGASLIAERRGDRRQESR